jgi:hypothetical protein
MAGPGAPGVSQVSRGRLAHHRGARGGSCPSTELRRSAHRDGEPPPGHDAAHADRTGLLEFLAPAADAGSSIYLVHGDEDTALAFADTLREHGHASVTVPEAYARYPLHVRSDRT